jgi:transcriptional regulator with XRE-family HTH domain
VDQWQEPLQSLTLPGASSPQPKVFAAEGNVPGSPEKPLVPLKEQQHQKALISLQSAASKQGTRSVRTGQPGRVSYAQIGRYETKGSQPPAAVLKKIADALDTTVDFIINGNTEDKAKAPLADAEVIRYFKEVDTLPQEDKTALLRVIGGFIRDVKTKQAYAS